MLTAIWLHPKTRETVYRSVFYTQAHRTPVVNRFLGLGFSCVCEDPLRCNRGILLLCRQQRQLCLISLDSRVAYWDHWKQMPALSGNAVKVLLPRLHLMTHVDRSQRQGASSSFIKKHHFYTSLFCFTQCALKISNNSHFNIALH